MTDAKTLAALRVRVEGLEPEAMDNLIGRGAKVLCPEPADAAPHQPGAEQ